jgi:anti-anti-sigma factor
MQVTSQAPHPTPPRPAPNPSPGLNFIVDHPLHHQTRLAVAGDIDIATADSLTDAATNALHSSTRLLIVDLAGVSFCGAAGITALIRIHRAASDAGASLALANVGTQLQCVFDVVNMNGILAALSRSPNRPEAPRRQRGGDRP